MVFKRHKAYDKTTYDGLTVDWFTRAALESVEEKRGATINLTQGSYSPGYDASAGTHDGGGTVDAVSDNPKRLARDMSDGGFAAFHRPPNWDGKGGIEHVHAVLKGNSKASPLAAAQAAHFDEHRDGLGSSYTSPPFGEYKGYVPKKPVTFDYQKWQDKQSVLSRLTRLRRKRERLNSNINDLRKQLRKINH